MSYTERNFTSRGTLNVKEVDENPLRGFGAEIKGAYRVFGYALKSFEHKIKLSYAGKIAVAADRAFDFVLGDVVFHLFVRPTGKIDFETVFCGVIFDKIIGSVTGFAGFAIHKRVGKTAHVTACHPNVGVHQDSAVETYVIFVLLNELFPPSLFYIVFEFDAERTVVPGVCESAVNFASGEDETSVLAQRDEFVHSKFCHNNSLKNNDF